MTAPTSETCGTFWISLLSLAHWWPLHSRQSHDLPLSRMKMMFQECFVCLSPVSASVDVIRLWKQSTAM